MAVKKFIIIEIIFFDLIILYGTAARISESNFACGYCHKEHNERWVHSTHKDVNCRICHIEPGIKGSIKAQINGVQNLWIAVTKGTDIKPHEDPIPISTKICLGCHRAVKYLNEIGFEDLPDNSLKGQSLIIAHRKHIEEYGIDCVECHRGVVHRNPYDIDKYKTNWPLMDKDCGVCHDGKKHGKFKMKIFDVEETDKCIKCHPTYEAPPDY